MELRMFYKHQVFSHLASVKTSENLMASVADADRGQSSGTAYHHTGVSYLDTHGMPAVGPLPGSRRTARISPKVGVLAAIYMWWPCTTPFDTQTFALARHRYTS